MNREILFRGKQIGSGEWVEGYLFTTNSAVFIAYADQFNDDLFYSTENIFIEVDSATVGQYTGLDDKNGAKIFEGDIVCRRWNEGSMKYKVVFDSFLSAFIGNRIGSAMFTSFDGDGDLFEVVGNIYDDPELEEVAQ